MEHSGLRPSAGTFTQPIQAHLDRRVARRYGLFQAIRGTSGDADDDTTGLRNSREDELSQFSDVSGR